MLHPVGAGTLGPVFRAYDSEHDRFVALKLFRLDLTPDRAHRVVGELESLVATKISHPALATPLAAGLVDASPYLAQDFVLGDALDVVARERGPLPPAEVIRLVTALAAGLDYAAASGAPHGGLHPRDVLMTAAGPRTTGIGVVRAFERLAVITPYRRPYAAPERTAGASWDARADVFSLAAMTYDLLWGRRMVGLGAEALLGVRPIEGAEMGALQRVFTCALSADPGGRFDKASTFAEELGAALARLKAPLEPSSLGFPLLGEREPSVSTGPIKGARERRPKMEPEPSLPLEEKSEAADDRLAPLDEKLPHLEAQASSPEEKAEFIEPVPGVDAAPPAERADALPVLSPLITSDVRVELPQPKTSNVWPLVLALVLGLSVGFAGGYGVGSRETGAVVSPPASGEAARTPGEPPASPNRPAAAASSGESRPPSAAVERPSEAAPLAAPVTKGRVAVRSTPSGGRVSLDGKEAGVAPLTLHDVAAGSHTIRVVLDGHVPVERRIVVSPDKPSQAIAVELAAARSRAREPDRAKPAAKVDVATQSVGSLQVDSRPAGANVFVDGKPAGKTPLVLESLRLGDHGIRLELEGYRPWNSSARITAGARSRVAASLEP